MIPQPIRLLPVFAAAAALGPRPAPAQTAGGYGDYTRWIDWARVRGGARAGLASSFDRTGGSRDYNHYEFPAGFRTTDETVTATTIAGPGIVYRFWMPHQAAAHAFAVRMYFDGETSPRLDTTSDRLLSGNHAAFAPPLVTTFAGGQVSYEPIPFARSLRIETNNRADGARHYYQYSYVTFAPGTPIASWTAVPPPENAAARQAVRTLFDRVGSHPGPPAGIATRTIGAASIAAGRARTIADVPGPGVIRSIRLGMSAAEDADLDGLRLVVTYDGSPAPAIDVPVSAFFGVGHDRAPYRSLPLGADSSGKFYCYWPMPFRKSARIELRNDRTFAIGIDSASAELETTRVPEDLGSLYARYRHARRTPGQQLHTLLSTSGQGHYVGSFLSVRQETDDPTILEGDDIVTVDGVEVLNGTGLEDVYNGGYYYNWVGDPGPEPEGTRPVSAIRPLHGLLFADLDVGATPLTRTDQYRWRIADRVPFEQSILVQLQTVGIPGTVYESVAFWYAIPPPAVGPGPPDESGAQMQAARIERIVPNPTPTATRIAYTLPVEMHAVLEIVSVTGRHVATLVSGLHTAGRHEVPWSPPPGRSGVYFCRLRAGDTESTRKIVVTRTER